MPTNHPLNSLIEVRNIIKSLRRGIDAGDRDRGIQYFKQRRVENLIVDRSGRFAEAQVGGSVDFPYDVQLETNPSSGSATIDCDCPRFSEGKICKHAWAVLLELEHRLKNPSKDKLAPSSKPNIRRKVQAKPGWEELLDSSRDPFRPDEDFSVLQIQAKTPQQSKLLYVIDVSAPNMQLVILEHTEGCTGIGKSNGDGKRNLSQTELNEDDLNSIRDPIDRELTCLLLGIRNQPYHRSNFESVFELPNAAAKSIWQLLVKSKRLYWSLDPYHCNFEDLHPIRQSEFSRPASITPIIEDCSTGDNVSTMQVALQREGQKLIDNDKVVALDIDTGLALLVNEVVELKNPQAVDFWVNAHNLPKPVRIKQNEQAAFLKKLLTVPGIDDVSIPKSWSVKKATGVEPIPRLTILTHQTSPRTMNACVWFVYGEQVVRAGNPDTAVLGEQAKQFVSRNMEFEFAAIKALEAYPLTVEHDRNGEQEIDFSFNKRNLLRIVDELSELGWEIVLERSRVRRSSSVNIQVQSDKDWFDLSAKVDFQGNEIGLPSLLKAVKAKDNFIKLADGSQGRLPDELIKKYARLADLGTTVDDVIRFQPTQAMLLDAMLDADDRVKFDKNFLSVREKLLGFNGIKPKDAVRSFKGTLRDYQREGLGWLNFLREYGFGGCLADDMGLGKTVQVLALLEARRTRRKMKEQGRATKKNAALNPRTLTTPFLLMATSQSRKPSIVVVPKSLIFNWIEEAKKFTPSLRILNYTGPDRFSRSDSCEGFDVLLTTYGLLQKDIGELAKIEFDYAILDESQAIKNSKTLCAKACRLLRADHRLAMTGTPIENHLGELWSLFEFLNPGMLGGAAGFARLTNQKKAGTRERKATQRALSKGLAPFFLRRTKKQVLSELPDKTEQTLFCDMEPAQKKKYDELKEFYRVKLAKKVETEGIGKTKIQVLEALLRLRQVACDPRLLDSNSDPGTKLELLNKQVTELIAEGHKILVFSQFTSLLSLVRQQFEESKIQYEYLDGQTNNRQARVERFQKDESVSAFLISMKAGGSGLNLTAADYVFLLDPWWNPAVEAQAIDRAHRMGQQRSVMAYRMICRGTVEEKIIELQQSKRELADSVIRADQSLIKSLTASDLGLLLS